jgi:hypothetical protein
MSTTFLALYDQRPVFVRNGSLFTGKQHRFPSCTLLLSSPDPAMVYGSRLAFLLIAYFLPQFSGRLALDLWFIFAYNGSMRAM